MSETPAKTEADVRPSLRKKPVTTGTDEQPKRLPVPAMVNYACIALVITAVALLARAVTLLGGTSTLEAYIVKANAAAKKPTLTPAQISSDVHSFRQGTLLMSVVIAIALVLLALAFRRVRTASGSRWAMLIVMVFTSLPFSVVPIHGLPGSSNVAGEVSGIGAILAILLIFVPPASQKYFRDCRDAALPPELRGQPRPSLFGPRRQRPGLAGPGGRAAAARANAESVRAGSAATVRPAGAPKARAKVRSDAEAVARGAELARSRAKASKSRRTAD